MKKQIIKSISFVMVFVLMTLSLTSCFVEILFGGDMGDMTHTHDFTEKFNSSLSFKECNICGYKTDYVNLDDDGFNDKNIIELNANDKDKDLILSLIDYFTWKRLSLDMISLTIEEKIDRFKNAEQILLVDYNPLDYYFVCAYSDAHYEVEKASYCCIEDYTWVKYKNVSDIQEYYNGKKIIQAFQLNNASLVTDICSDEASTPHMEHFMGYKPKFENGINVNEAVVFDKIYVYLNSSDKAKVYDSWSSKTPYHPYITFDCILLDNQYYILELTHYVINGIYYDMTDTIIIEYGNYYDTLMEVMILDKYSVDRNDDEMSYYETSYYGLIDVNDFADYFLK
jgi:hypothetical protein